MSLIPVAPTGDFEKQDGRGELIAAELTPGEYEVFAWRVASGYATVSPVEAFSIRFKVEPSALVYLGNFHFTQTSSMGLTVTGVTVEHRERAERDLGVLRKKFPMLSKAKVSSAIAPGTQVDMLGGRPSTNVSIPPYIPPAKR